MIQSIPIYPDSFADMLKARAGQKYRPSNGTEGECFIESWCGGCARDRSLREGAPLEECGDNEVCKIVGATFAYRVTDPEYPSEWQYGPDGQPRCTAFVEAGKPIPAPRCTQTSDLFATPSSQKGTADE